MDTTEVGPVIKKSDKAEISRELKETFYRLSGKYGVPIEKLIEFLLNNTQLTKVCFTHFTLCSSLSLIHLLLQNRLRIWKT